MKSLVLFIASIFIFCALACQPGKRLTTYGGIGPDKSLYYYHQGSGEPIIVVHGGPGMNHAYLLPYINRLANRHHMIYYDQRACGLSEVPTDTTMMRMSSFVNDIDQIRKKFGLKKFHLMAHSWGTMLAVQYAVKYPEFLSSLILISPAAISSLDVRESSKLMNGRYDYSDQLKRNQIIESVDFKTGQPEAMREMIRISFKQNMAQKHFVDSLRIYMPLDYKEKNLALRYLFKDLANYDLYPILKSIKSSTLIVVGDQEIGIQIAKKIKKEIPTSTYHTIQDAGHFPFVEQPSLFDQTVLDFLSKIKS